MIMQTVLYQNCVIIVQREVSFALRLKQLKITIVKKGPNQIQIFAFYKEEERLILETFSKNKNIIFWLLQKLLFSTIRSPRQHKFSNICTIFKIFVKRKFFVLYTYTFFNPLTMRYLPIGLTFSQQNAKNIFLRKKGRRSWMHNRDCTHSKDVNAKEPSSSSFCVCEKRQKTPLLNDGRLTVGEDLFSAVPSIAIGMHSR